MFLRPFQEFVYRVLEKMAIFILFCFSGLVLENNRSMNRKERNENESNFELLFSFLFEEFVRRSKGIFL